MTVTRRSLLKLAGLTPLMGAVPRLASAAEEGVAPKPTTRFGLEPGWSNCHRNISSPPPSITASSPGRF